MKRLLLIVIVGLLLSGCATYNAMNDPVYHAYLRGEIDYATYLDHYHRTIAEHQRRAQAVSQALNQGLDDLERQRQENYQRRQAIYDDFQRQRQTDALESIDRTLKWGY